MDMDQKNLKAPTHAYVAFTRFHKEQKIVPIQNIKGLVAAAKIEQTKEYLVKDKKAKENEDNAQDALSYSSSSDDEDYFPAQVVKLGFKQDLEAWSTKKSSRVVIPPVKEHVIWPLNKNHKKGCVAENDQPDDNTSVIQQAKKRPLKTEENALKVKKQAKETSLKANLKSVLTLTEEKHRLETLAGCDIKEPKSEESRGKSKNKEQSDDKNSIVLLLKAENINLKKQVSILEDTVAAYKLNTETLQLRIKDLENKNNAMLRERSKFKEQLHIEKPPTKKPEIPDWRDVPSCSSSSGFVSNTSNEHASSQHAISPCEEDEVGEFVLIEPSCSDQYDDVDFEVSHSPTDNLKSDSDVETTTADITKSTTASNKHTKVSINDKIKEPSPTAEPGISVKTPDRLSEMKRKRSMTPEEDRDLKEWYVRVDRSVAIHKNHDRSFVLMRSFDGMIHVGFGRYIHSNSWNTVKKSKTYRKLICNLIVALLGEDVYKYNKTGTISNRKKDKGKKENDEEKPALESEKKKFPEDVVAIVEDFIWRFFMREHKGNLLLVETIIKTIDYVSVMADAAREKDPLRKKKRVDAQTKKKLQEVDNKTSTASSRNDHQLRDNKPVQEIAAEEITDKSDSE